MPDSQDSIHEQLRGEIEAMLSHLSGRGQPLPSAALAVCEQLRAGRSPPLTELASAHAMLAKLVAPAYPAVLRMLADHQQQATRAGFWARITLRNVFVVPLTQIFANIAVLSLLLLIALSAMGIGGASAAKVELAWYSPLVLSILNRTFIAACASLGAAFHVLFNVNTLLVENTYDSKYEVSYILRYVMGVITGVILASLETVTSQLQSIPLSLLALLGGFSTTLVYQLLERMTTGLEKTLSAAPAGGDRGRASGEYERLELTSQIDQLRTLVQGRGSERSAVAVPEPRHTSPSPVVAPASGAVPEAEAARVEAPPAPVMAPAPEAEVAPVETPPSPAVAPAPEVPVPKTEAAPVEAPPPAEVPVSELPAPETEAAPVEAPAAEPEDAARAWSQAKHGPQGSRRREW